MVPKNRRNSVYGQKEIELNYVKIFIEYQTVNEIKFFLKNSEEVKTRFFLWIFLVSYKCI